jgi:hypothetical protein
MYRMFSVKGTARTYSKGKILEAASLQQKIAKHG